MLQTERHEAILIGDNHEKEMVTLQRQLEEAIKHSHKVHQDMSAMAQEDAEAMEVCLICFGLTVQCQKTL